MSAHRFQVGETVEVLARAGDDEVPSGAFVVTERYHHQGELYYCVKSRLEPFERALPEDRLTAVARERAPFIRLPAGTAAAGGGVAGRAVFDSSSVVPSAGHPRLKM